MSDGYIFKGKMSQLLRNANLNFQWADACGKSKGKKIKDFACSLYFWSRSTSLVLYL